MVISAKLIHTKETLLIKWGGVKYEYLNPHDDRMRVFLGICFRFLSKLRATDNMTRRIRTRLSAMIHSNKKYQVDLIHSFNAIIDTEIPYVITFETGLPRCVELLNYHHEIKNAEYNSTVKHYIKMLQSEKCKRLIAMSSSAKKICEAELSEGGAPDFVLNKITVLHPPQRVLVTRQEVADRYSKLLTANGKIRFIFVGRDFFRKGGKEVVTGLSKYADRCELFIISSMNCGDYATHSTENEKKQIMDYISSSGWIQWFESCENEKVLELCKTAHVGLLPTFADTYGYSVLEMQACGLPVITTDIRALPEINNEGCGWVAHLPVNKYGEALYSREESREKMKQILQSQLDDIFESIFSDYNCLEGKAIASLERIEKYHSPEAYEDELRKIYAEAI